MVKVAVAGGTGGIGRHIVEGILETKKHDVVVLSRTPHCPELEALGANVVAVSYADPASLEHALAGVHTVISTIAAFDRAGFVESQLALIEAARKVGAKRFAPSEFAIRALHDDPIVLFRMKAEVADAAKASGMEYTLFENGMFMNYLACGTSGIGHLRSFTYIVDVGSCKADVPGDGENHLVWTRAEDVGRFVAASLELEAWPEVSSMSGDRKTLNELIKAAESVRGKRFDATHMPAEDIEKQLSADPAAFFANFHKQTLLELVRTSRTAYEDANLNRMCPQVKPVGIEEFLKTWWGKA